MSEEKTPYQRGYEAALRGEQCPSKPRGDASWADKLYNAGWTKGNLDKASESDVETKRADQLGAIKL